MGYLAALTHMAPFESKCFLFKPGAIYFLYLVCHYYSQPDVLINTQYLVNGAPKRSKISVQFDNLGFRLMSPGDLTDDELDATLDLLHNRTNSQEKTQLLQVKYILLKFITKMLSLSFSCLAAKRVQWSILGGNRFLQRSD